MFSDILEKPNKPNDISSFKKARDYYDTCMDYS